MDLTAQIFTEKDINNEIIKIEGVDIFEKVLVTSILGDWVSFHLAQLYKVDPTSSAFIEEFKKRLEQS